MPRNRNKRTSDTPVVDEPDSAQSAQTQGENNMSATETETTDFDFLGDELSEDLIASLLGDTRSRGEYGEYLTDFIKSGKVGLEVKFDGTDPRMAGKDADKAKTGFENAKKQTVKDSDPPVLKIAGSNNVKVVKKNTGSKETPELHLFLINTAVVASKQKEAAAE